MTVTKWPAGTAVANSTLVRTLIARPDSTTIAWPGVPSFMDSASPAWMRIGTATRPGRPPTLALTRPPDRQRDRLL